MTDLQIRNRLRDLATEWRVKGASAHDVQRLLRLVWEYRTAHDSRDWRERADEALASAKGGTE